MLITSCSCVFVIEEIDEFLLISLNVIFLTLKIYLSLFRFAEIRFTLLAAFLWRLEVRVFESWFYGLFVLTTGLGLAFAVGVPRPHVLVNSRRVAQRFSDFLPIYQNMKLLWRPYFLLIKFGFKYWWFVLSFSTSVRLFMQSGKVVKLPADLCFRSVFFHFLFYSFGKPRINIFDSKLVKVLYSSLA